MKNLNFEGYENNQYEFVVHDKVTVFLIRHANKFLFVAWLIILIIESVNIENSKFLGFVYPENPVSFNTILPIFIILGLAHFLFWYKHIYGVTFSENLVTIFSYRVKKPIEYELIDLKAIVISGLFIFRFSDGKSYWLMDYNNLDFIKFLIKTQTSVEWGKLGEIKFRKIDLSKF